MFSTLYTLSQLSLKSYKFCTVTVPISQMKKLILCEAELSLEVIEPGFEPQILAEESAVLSSPQTLDIGVSLAGVRAPWTKPQLGCTPQNSLCKIQL